MYSLYCSATLKHTHTHTHTQAKDTLCTCLLFLTLSVSVGDTQSYTHTGPLTAKVVIEPHHQVEGCILFRGAFAPCLSCHLVPKTTLRFPPVFMGTLRGHPQQPLGEATLALASALAASPLFWGGVFKELPGAWTS